MSRFPAPAFDHYWNMWNEPDVERVRHHLELAVSVDFDFCDPIHHHIGRDALEQNVREFRASQPDATFRLGSAVDSHHDRHRYEWHLVRNDRVLVRGFDVATVDATGLIERIDGFFGPLTPLPEDA